MPASTCPDTVQTVRYSPASSAGTSSVAVSPSCNSTVAITSCPVSTANVWVAAPSFVTVKVSASPAGAVDRLRGDRELRQRDVDRGRCLGAFSFSALAVRAPVAAARGRDEHQHE